LGEGKVSSFSSFSSLLSYLYPAKKNLVKAGERGKDKEKKERQDSRPLSFRPIPRRDGRDVSPRSYSFFLSYWGPLDPEGIGRQSPYQP